MKEKYLILLFFSFFSFKSLHAQKDSANYKNRIGIGVGGETGFMGIDYSRGFFKTKIFVGIGCGLGTGWTGYLRYEPVEIVGIHPFLSSGISHSFNGTLIVSEGTSTFFVSTGLGFFPKLNWKVVPGLSAGATYYSIINGAVEGGSFGIGPSVKLEFAF